jgi:hypothetical protein
MFCPLVMPCRGFMRSDKYFTDTQADFYLRLIQVFVNTA